MLLICLLLNNQREKTFQQSNISISEDQPSVFDRPPTGQQLDQVKRRNGFGQLCLHVWKEAFDHEECFQEKHQKETEGIQQHLEEELICAGKERQYGKEGARKNYVF